MRHRLLISIIATAGFLLAACGTDGETAAPVDTGAGASTVPPTDPPRGWVEGEPEWLGSTEEGMGGGDGAEAPAAAGAEAERYAMDDADTVTVGAGEESMPVEPGATPAPVDGPLRAGSVDDNADFDAFLAYLERIATLGITTREFDPAGRVVVRVVGTSGRPVAGAEVIVSNGEAEIARLRATADGTVRFHPALHGAAGATELTVASGGASATVAPGGTVELASSDPGGANEPVAVDVLFLLDATGSMSDEIDRLKTSIDSVATRIASLETRPDVRFAMTLYRDEGDTFVTASYDFTPDVEAFRTALAEVVADGGGDYPEALDEGLAEALTVPTWRPAGEALQFVFLVADAPPQVARQVEQGYPDSIRDAIGRGIKIFPVASSESDDQAEAVFRQIAQATGARFVFLSYGAGGAATGGSTDIDRTDYEELALDDLVVRLVSEELAALTGDAVPVPTTTTVVPTTNPQGQ